MNNMSDEEQIEIIKQRLSDTKIEQRYSNAPKISLNYIRDMETLLNLYNKEREKNIMKPNWFFLKEPLLM